MIWHDIEQNTQEWMDLRKGKVTSSAVNLVMANFGKAFGNPAKKYAAELALERITGGKVKENYSNQHMENGHDFEPLAKKAYEQETFTEITNGGFFEDGNTGDSPDGLVGSNGMVEIKSVTTHVHTDTIRKGKYDAKYKWQNAFHLKVSGRDWVDYVSYGIFFPTGSNLFIDRITKESMIEEFQMIDERLFEFENLVQENIEILFSQYPALKAA